MYTFHYTLPYLTLAYLNPCCYIINSCGCNNTIDYIPIRLDIRPYLIPNTWDDPSELPSMSGDRYFLKIYSPHIDNSITTPKDTPHNHIKIDKYGIYSNFVLIGLLPSPSRSIKGCYRVEYYRWNKYLITPNTDLGCKVDCGIIKPITDVYPSTQLLKIEWWYVGRKFPTCKNTGYKQVQMVRKDDDRVPIPNNTDYIPIDITKDILLIDKLVGVPSEYQDDWSLVMEQVPGPYNPQIKERVITSLGIKWGTGPRAGTPYTISYKIPLTIEDIIYRPSKREQDLLNINTY